MTRAELLDSFSMLEYPAFNVARSDNLLMRELRRIRVMILRMDDAAVSSMMDDIDEESLAASIETANNAGLSDVAAINDATALFPASEDDE